MAHNTTIYRRESVINITFNEFYARMVGFSNPMGEGWYRITDFQTTGYVLDRTQDVANQGYPLTYGCPSSPTNVGDTTVEPLIVRVTVDLETGLNRHDHRVYSELHPDDEIYWTWDWGFRWDWYLANVSGAMPFQIEERFLEDATLFGPHPDYQDSYPLEMIESAYGYGIPDQPAGGVVAGNGSYDPITIVDWHRYDPNATYFQFYRGFIYHRKDTKRNITGPYDWREVYLARYSSEGAIDSWNGGNEYKTGDVVVANDGWIYICLQRNVNQNPILYDAYNNPGAAGQTYGPIYVWWSLNVPPSSAFSPKSMRRAWLRLWPITYKWYSPWANGLSEDGNRVMTYYIGNQDLPYDQNDSLGQPIYTEIWAKTRYIVKTFSGEDDSVSDNSIAQNEYKYLFDIDLGTPSTVPLGPWYEPPTQPFRPGDWVNEFGDPFWEGQTFGGLYNDDYPLRIIHPVGNYRSSFVNDNRIVTFDGDKYDHMNINGHPRGGLIKGIRFGNNSAGNTFYMVPLELEGRQKVYADLYNFINESSNSYPIHHLAYGSGWQSFVDGEDLGVEPLDWPIKPKDFGDTGSINIPIHEISINPHASFGNNDFGDNFIGNVAFGALYFYGSLYPEMDYPFIDNAYLSSTVDGSFHGCKFKNSNRFNLFLHGMANVEIDSSEASILECLSDFKASQTKSDLIRDCYQVEIGKSWYNSLYHLIGINQQGNMAHNYVDSLYSTSIGDNFSYNSIGFFYLYEDLPKVNVIFPFWPNQDSGGPKEGLYFESGKNRISNNFVLNRHRGWIIDCSFESSYFINKGCSVFEAVPYLASYLMSSSFGVGIALNYFYDIARTKVDNRSAQGLNLCNAQLLPLFINKKITRSAKWTFGNWVEEDALLIWDDSDGQRQVQKYGDPTFVIPTIGPPFPDF